MDYRYQYDAAGNITQRSTEDGDYFYGYDPLDRHTGATPPAAWRYNENNELSAYGIGADAQTYRYD